MEMELKLEELQWQLQWFLSFSSFMKEYSGDFVNFNINKLRSRTVKGFFLTVPLGFGL